MTQRKPPGVSFDAWVEQQIRTEQNRGGFDKLPGQGRPLARPERHEDLMDWVAAKLRRENLDATAILPPSLALPKEVEGLAERLGALRSERAVREAVEDLNARIVIAHRRPQEGPPLRVMPLDVERLVAAWRESRPRPPQPPPPPERTGRAPSRWRGLRARRSPGSAGDELSERSR